MPKEKRATTPATYLYKLVYFQNGVHGIAALAVRVLGDASLAPAGRVVDLGETNANRAHNKKKDNQVTHVQVASALKHLQRWNLFIPLNHLKTAPTDSCF